MGNSLKPQIENAQKTGVCNLKAKGLRELPPEISRLPKTLRTLELSDNRLLEIPPVIGQFSNLKTLSLNNNKLTHLPHELNNLVKLDTLLLSINSLQSFHLTSGNLFKNLKTITVAQNKLKEFPECLCTLPNVDAIDLSDNQIKELTSANIASLSAIELNMNRNRLAVLSSELAACKRLKVLRVEENCLPINMFSCRLLKESQIAVLAFDGNLFDMKEFQDLEGYDQYIQRYAANKKKFA